MKKNLLYKFSHFYLIVIISLFHVGCSSEVNGSEDVTSANKVAVTFSVEGINEIADAPAPKSLMAGTNKTVTIAENKTHSIGNGANVVISMDKGSMASSPALGSSATASTGRVVPYAGTMTGGNTYRVLVYDSNNNHVGTIDQVAGPNAVESSLDLVKGGSYTWYAFSYNDASVLPAVDPVTLKVPATIDKDLLYATGQFSTVSAGNYHQKITFNHAMARIRLTVDAVSAVALIKAVNAGFSDNTKYIRQGSYDLKAQNFANSSDYSVQSSDFKFTETNTSTGEMVKTAVIYTVPNASVNDPAINGGHFIVKINTMEVRDLSGTNITSNVSNTSFDYGSVAPAKGTSYNFRITLKKTIEFAGNEWAPGNLWYDKTETDERFRYKIRQDGISHSGSTYRDMDYWGWGSELPGITNATTLNAFIDPCTKVYPAGAWRMASRNDFKEIIKLIPNSAPDSGTVPVFTGNPNSTAEYTSVPNGSMRFRKSPNDKWLQFFYDGYYTVGSNVNSGAAGTNGYFQVPDNFSNILGVNSYYTIFSVATIGTLTNWPTTESPHRLYNIRCVRSK